MLPLPPPARFRREYRSQRGVYRATEVPRDHETLRTIPMYGNMLQDHTSLSYFDALEEIAAVRVAEAKGEFMPEWVPFSESEVCQLCKADFSWASTSKSEVSPCRYSLLTLLRVCLLMENVSREPTRAAPLAAFQAGDCYA